MLRSTREGRKRVALDDTSYWQPSTRSSLICVSSLLVSVPRSRPGSMSKRPHPVAFPSQTSNMAQVPSRLANPAAVDAEAAINHEIAQSTEPPSANPDTPPPTEAQPPPAIETDSKPLLELKPAPAPIYSKSSPTTNLPLGIPVLQSTPLCQIPIFSSDEPGSRVPKRCWHCLQLTGEEPVWCGKCKEEWYCSKDCMYRMSPMVIVMVFEFVKP